MTRDFAGCGAFIGLPIAALFVACGSGPEEPEPTAMSTRPPVPVMVAREAIIQSATGEGVVVEVLALIGSTSSPPTSPDPSPLSLDDREHGVLGYEGSGDPLTEVEMRAVLTAAGWPEELHAEALAVAYCESSWRPGVVGDGGKARGLFQIHASPWFAYAGEDLSAWANPVTNARTAWAVYQYDIARGYVPWQQWACRRVL